MLLGKRQFLERAAGYRDPLCRTLQLDPKKLRASFAEDMVVLSVASFSLTGLILSSSFVSDSEKSFDKKVARQSRRVL